MSAATILLSPCLSRAQSMTFNHDDPVMNQFTVGETGVGGLTPDWWYDLAHKNYRNSAMTTNKLFYRSGMKLVLTPEEGHAEALDSALTERKRVEMQNIADRTPGISDLAWQVEKGKITSKLSILKSNIERLTLEGAPARDYHTWLECYNAISCGLQAVRDAYMPQGKRKEQYIEIYKDILLKNSELCTYIAYLRSVREADRVSGSSRPLPVSRIGMLARTAHGRWKVAMTVGSGRVGGE